MRTWAWGAGRGGPQADSRWVNSLTQGLIPLLWDHDLSQSRFCCLTHWATTMPLHMWFLMTIQFIKKQGIHTQVLENGVYPCPHNGLVCSSHSGGGTKTQESLMQRKKPARWLSDFKRWSVPHWCMFTRVGARKRKGESAHKGRDCSPLKPSLPSAPGAGRGVEGSPWLPQTLSLLSQWALFFFGSPRSKEETIYWVTTVFNAFQTPRKRRPWNELCIYNRPSVGQGLAGRGWS